MWRQKEKEEDQRGQGRDFENCLGEKMARERGVRFRRGWIDRVTETSVAINM